VPRAQAPVAGLDLFVRIAHPATMHPRSSLGPLLALALAVGGCTTEESEPATTFVPYGGEASTGDAATGDAMTADQGAADGHEASLEAGEAEAGDATAEEASCPEPIVISRPGHLFSPSVSVPVFREDIAMPSGLFLRKVELDLTFTRGPWASPAPANGGIHNIFWLHRGNKGNHWLNNTVGYMNIKGLHALDLSTNLGITDKAVWSQNLTIDSFPTTQGETFSVRYVYDAAGNVFSFAVLQAGKQIGYREGDPLLDVIQAADCWDPAHPAAPGFFIEIGNLAWDGSGGPEVPTYDWDYADLEIRFFPVCGP
jgi:hypothetical protein